MGHFYGLSYLTISGNKQVENIFLESFQFHARMRSSEIAQSLKSYGHFCDHGFETALSHYHDAFFGYSKYINQLYTVVVCVQSNVFMYVVYVL